MLGHTGLLLLLWKSCCSMARAERAGVGWLEAQPGLSVQLQLGSDGRRCINGVVIEIRNEQCVVFREVVDDAVSSEASPSVNRASRTPQATKRCGKLRVTLGTPQSAHDSSLIFTMRSASASRTSERSLDSESQHSDI